MEFSFNENMLYGLILVVALVGCFLYGYGDCVQIIVSGVIGAYTGNRLARGGSDGDGDESVFGC